MKLAEKKNSELTCSPGAYLSAIYWLQYVIHYLLCIKGLTKGTKLFA